MSLNPPLPAIMKAKESRTDYPAAEDVELIQLAQHILSRASDDLDDALEACLGKRILWQLGNFYHYGIVERISTVSHRLQVINERTGRNYWIHASSVCWDVMKRS